jgi:GDPmannose 4,6-dehydratase
MQWLMLQQDKPEDFVIATGVQYSVREFIAGGSELGIELRSKARAWTRSACQRQGDNAPASSRATCWCASTRATSGRPKSRRCWATRPRPRPKLGWVPEITLDALIDEMVASDSDDAKRHALLHTPMSIEA